MNNNSRTIGIIAIIVTVLCCACPGLGLAIAGLMGLAGVPFTTVLQGLETARITSAVRSRDLSAKMMKPPAESNAFKRVSTRSLSVWSDPQAPCT